MTILVCIGNLGELVTTLETRDAPPETLAAKGYAFRRQYERRLGNQVVAVYGVIPQGVTKTETK